MRRTELDSRIVEWLRERLKDRISEKTIRPAISRIARKDASTLNEAAAKFAQKHDESLPRRFIKPARAQQSTMTPTKTKKTVAVKVNKKMVSAFGLPLGIIEEARRMSDIYPDLYLFENFVRYVIMSVLEDKYTVNWWENRNVVSKNIADEVEKRKHFEKENRWVAKRGTHNIFYTTFGELARIINLNTKDFRKIFANMEIEAELRKLEPFRNIIAHNNPLLARDRTRIKTALDDLQKQLEEYNKRNKP